MRVFFRAGRNTGFSLGPIGTVIFLPFLFLGWLFTLPLKLFARR